MKDELINIAKTPLVHKKHGVSEKTWNKSSEGGEFLDKVKRRRNKDVME